MRPSSRRSASSCVAPAYRLRVRSSTSGVCTLCSGGASSPPSGPGSCARCRAPRQARPALRLPTRARRARLGGRGAGRRDSLDPAWSEHVLRGRARTSHWMKMTCAHVLRAGRWTSVITRRGPDLRVGPPATVFAVVADVRDDRQYRLFDQGNWGNTGVGMYVRAAGARASLAESLRARRLPPEADRGAPSRSATRRPDDVALRVAQRVAGGTGSTAPRRSARRFRTWARSTRMPQLGSPRREALLVAPSRSARSPRRTRPMSATSTTSTSCSCTTAACRTRRCAEPRAVRGTRARARRRCRAGPCSRARLPLPLLPSKGARGRAVPPAAMPRGLDGAEPRADAAERAAGAEPGAVGGADDALRRRPRRRARRRPRSSYALRRLVADQRAHHSTRGPRVAGRDVDDLRPVDDVPAAQQHARRRRVRARREARALPGRELLDLGVVPARSCRASHTRASPRSMPVSGAPAFAREPVLRGGGLRDDAAAGLANAPGHHGLLYLLISLQVRNSLFLNAADRILPPAPVLEPLPAARRSRLAGLPTRALAGAARRAVPRPRQP